MVTTNLKRHEFIGLFLIFISGTLLGFGLFGVFWGANRPLLYGDASLLIRGKEYLLFPLVFGTGFVAFALGQIELKEAQPGKKR